jgi:hypothetical protein
MADYTSRPDDAIAPHICTLANFGLRSYNGGSFNEGAGLNRSPRADENSFVPQNAPFPQHSRLPGFFTVYLYAEFTFGDISTENLEAAIEDFPAPYRERFWQWTSETPDIRNVWHEVLPQITGNPAQRVPDIVAARKQVTVSECSQIEKCIGVQVIHGISLSTNDL